MEELPVMRTPFDDGGGEDDGDDDDVVEDDEFTKSTLSRFQATIMWCVF